MGEIGSTTCQSGLLIATGLFVSLSIVANAGETVYTKHIKPVFDRQCAVCHGKDAPEHGDFKRDREGYTKKGLGPKMDSYAHLASYAGWPDSGAIMRRLDDGKNAKDGKPGNMYAFLGATDQDRARNLATLKSWLGEGAWNLNRWEARSNVPGITKEQLDKVKAKF